MFLATTLSIRHLVSFSYKVAFLGFITCIGLTLLKDFESANRTRCHVFDFLPTLSTSTAYFTPQCYIWRFCFALTSFPRYLTGFLQMQYRLLRPHMAQPKYYRFVERINGCLHFLELTCLLILSFVSLSETAWVHIYSYFCFALFSVTHMYLTASIDYLWPRTMYLQLTELEMKLRAKRLKWFLINMPSFCISMSFYLLHWRICQPLIYSTHSLFEYIFILTNISYHGVMMEEWDEQGRIHISFWNEDHIPMDPKFS